MAFPHVAIPRSIDARSVRTESQTRRVWDCQSGLPRTARGGFGVNGMGIYGSPISRVWARDWFDPRPLRQSRRVHERQTLIPYET